MYRILAACILFPTVAIADPAVVVNARAVAQGGNSWTFHVTLRHDDTGWEDYADGWQVEHPDGTVLGLRVLYHPHVNEQPFTRSLSKVIVPEGLSAIQIRARTLTDGWGETTFNVDLTQ